MGAPPHSKPRFDCHPRRIVHAFSEYKHTADLDLMIKGRDFSRWEACRQSGVSCTMARGWLLLIDPLHLKD